MHIIYLTSWNNVKKPPVLVSAWLFVRQSKMLYNSALRGLTLGCRRLKFLFTSLVREKHRFEAVSAWHITAAIRNPSASPQWQSRSSCRGHLLSFIHSLVMREGRGRKAEYPMWDASHSLTQQAELWDKLPARLQTCRWFQNCVAAEQLFKCCLSIQPGHLNRWIHTFWGFGPKSSEKTSSTGTYTISKAGLTQSS